MSIILTYEQDARLMKVFDAYDRKDIERDQVLCRIYEILIQPNEIRTNQGNTTERSESSS